jgi:hypothetical protein
MARCIAETGATTFIDVNDIATGDDYKRRIRDEIGHSNEIVVLFTNWSRRRAWLWAEIGAAWFAGIRIIAIMYETTQRQLEDEGGFALVDSLHFRSINSFESYLKELQERVASV